MLQFVPFNLGEANGRVIINLPINDVSVYIKVEFVYDFLIVVNDFHNGLDLNCLLSNFK